MRLCFGIFAEILNCCNRGLSQDKFVPRIAWVIDEKNSSLGYENQEISDDIDDILEKMQYGNASVVSKLLSCKQSFVVKDMRVIGANERFKEKVLPYIDTDKIPWAVLAILYVINYDEFIDESHRETFKKYLGFYKEELLCQTAFDIPDFFTKVLLYTTCIDNRSGQPYAAEITDKFIEEVKISSLAKAKWNEDAKKVELVNVELSEKIDEFSDKIRFLSELRLPFVEDQMNFCSVDTSWLGEDGEILFPKQHAIEFRDSKAKKEATDKMKQCIKLARECSGYLRAAKMEEKEGQQSIFLDEGMRDVYQQFNTLYNELFYLYLFPDRFKPE